MSHASPLRWQPALPQARKLPALAEAMWRGACGRCPNCGGAKLFRGYLKVTESCASCAAPLGLARADDAPPYFTILIVAHIVVPLVLWMERAFDPSVPLEMAIWVPVTLMLSLALLRPIKGATVGVIVARDMLNPDAETGRP